MKQAKTKNNGGKEMKIDKTIRDKIKQLHRKRVGVDAWRDFGIEKSTDEILDDIERLCK